MGGGRDMIETERALDCDEALMLVARDVTTGLDRARQAQLRAHLSRCPSCEQARGIVEHADDLEALPIVDPAYYVRGRVEGRGGMGRIIIARDRRLGRMVALKEILDDSLRERFEREIRVTARLDHPNIVTIHEAGRWPDGAPFFAMRWIDGESLASRLASLATWAERAALVPSLVAAAQAIAYAHGQRVVHRDLKPANILIGPYGETVVIDWGLAIDLDEHAERTTSGLSGTPHYMAPEQALGDPPDPRMDVYALGATLYHVITGAPPYTGSLEAVLESLLRGPPKPITAHVPDAPADLVAVVTKAMEHDPARRYPDAQSLADDLARFVAGQLVSVRLPPLRERIARWVRRHRAVVAVAAVALVAVAALGVWSLGERDRAARNEHAAHREKAQNERHAHRLHRALAQEVRALLQVDDDATRRAIFDLQLATPRLAWEAAPGTAAVTHVASSPSGKRIVAGHADGTVRAWQADGTPIHATKLAAHVLAVAIDDAGVVAASDKHGITVWRPGAPPLQLTTVGFAHALALDAAGTRLTASGAGAALALASWELRPDGTANLTHSQVRLDRRDAPFVALRGDGEVAAIVSGARPPRTLRIVSTRDGSLIRELADADHSRPWFSADGTRIYQRRGLDGIRAWHVASGEEDKNLRISGRSMPAVFASREHDSLRWLLAKEAGVTLLSPLTPIVFDHARAATFAGDLVVIGNSDGTVQAFDLVERCIGRRLPEPGHALAFDASARRLAIDAAALSVWTVDGRHVTDVRQPRTSSVDALAFADDMTLVVLARHKTDPRHLEWWNLATGERAAPPSWIVQREPFVVRALTERHVLLAAGGELALHELASGAVIASMPDPGQPVRVIGRPPRLVVDRRPTTRSPTDHLDDTRATHIRTLLDEAMPAAVSDDGEWIARAADGGVELFRTDDARSLLTAPPDEVAARVRRCTER